MERMWAPVVALKTWTMPRLGKGVVPMRAEKEGSPVTTSPPLVAMEEPKPESTTGVGLARKKRFGPVRDWALRGPAKVRSNARQRTGREVAFVRFMEVTIGY